MFLYDTRKSPLNYDNGILSDQGGGGREETSLPYRLEKGTVRQREKVH